MNAYELAEELDLVDGLERHANILTCSANVLRKQADRIAELERKFKEEFDYAEKLLKKANEK